MHLEPICAGMCAAREDRMTEVVPYLQAEIDLQTEQFDDVSQYVPERAAVPRDAGVPVRQRADDPADRIAGADLVGPRVRGVERSRRTGADGGQDQARRPARPSATARRHPRRQRAPARYGWRRTTSPRRAATRSPSAPTRPSRRSCVDLDTPDGTDKGSQRMTDTQTALTIACCSRSTGKADRHHHVEQPQAAQLLRRGDARCRRPVPRPGRRRRRHHCGAAARRRGRVQHRRRHEQRLRLVRRPDARDSGDRAGRAGPASAAGSRWTASRSASITT